ncbi:ABC-2 transporter permease [Acidobacteriota bacterium]
MLRLIQKNALGYLLIGLSLMILIVFYLLIRSGPFDPVIILFQGQMMIYGIGAGLLNSEQLEEKCQGYKFLRILPINDRDIVASKFAVLFISTVLLVGFNCTVYFFIGGDSNLFTIGRHFLLFCGNLSLIIGAFLLIFNFRFGAAKFIKIGWIIMVSVMILPLLFIEIVLPKININFQGILQAMAGLHWMLWVMMTLSVITIYFGLMVLAVKAKQTHNT